MSSRETAKKDAEERDLRLFLHEYEAVTGIAMRVIRQCERPDFEMERSGQVVGLELVQVRESPDQQFWRAVFRDGDQIDCDEASDAVQEAIYKKDVKRTSPGWHHPEKTILVVQLKGASGEDIFDYWDEEILTELCATGFMEIWLADHTPEEPHGTVEITGIKPPEWQGPHPHSRCGTKPFG